MLGGAVEGRRRVVDAVAVVALARRAQRAHRRLDGRALVRGHEVRALLECAPGVDEHGVGLVTRLDQHARLDVGLGIGERVLDHPLHVALAETVGRLHLDRRGLAGALLPGLYL